MKSDFDWKVYFSGLIALMWGIFVGVLTDDYWNILIQPIFFSFGMFAGRWIFKRV